MGPLKGKAREAPTGGGAAQMDGQKRSSGLSAAFAPRSLGGDEESAMLYEVCAIVKF